MKLCRVELCCVEFCWVELRRLELCWVVLWHMELCWVELSFDTWSSADGVLLREEILLNKFLVDRTLVKENLHWISEVIVSPKCSQGRFNKLAIISIIKKDKYQRVVRRMSASNENLTDSTNSTCPDISSLSEKLRSKALRPKLLELNLRWRNWDKIFIRKCFL